MKKPYFTQEEPNGIVSEPSVAMQHVDVSNNNNIAMHKNPFPIDSSGRILLTEKMKDDLYKAEQDYENGRCISEAQFERLFEKWL